MIPRPRNVTETAIAQFTNRIGESASVYESEVCVIRTVVAHQRALDRGALAFVLAAEDDIEVVAELDSAEDVPGALAERRGQIAVIDVDLLGPTGRAVPQVALNPPPGTRVLLLAELRHSRLLAPIMARRADVGFLTKDAPPERLVSAVRRVAAGEPVLDADLVMAAATVRSPLTLRETEVLAAASTGEPIKEIAAQLSLAPGTVRNHLSRIIAKTGGRTRIEALRIAQEAGWV